MDRTALFRQRQYKRSGITAGTLPREESFLNQGIYQPGRCAFFNRENPMQIRDIQFIVLDHGIENNELMEGDPFAKSRILPAAACCLGQPDKQVHQCIVIESRYFHSGCNIQLYRFLSRAEFKGRPALREGDHRRGNYHLNIKIKMLLFDGSKKHFLRAKPVRGKG